MLDAGGISRDPESSFLVGHPKESYLRPQKSRRSTTINALFCFQGGLWQI